MKKAILLFLTILIFQPTFAKKTFEFNANIKEAYQNIMDLKFKRAESIIQLERQKNPNNLMSDFMEDYIDYYSILVDGSEAKFKKLSSNKSKRLDAMEGGDMLSPYYLYTKAEIKIHWAILRSSYGDKLTAFREMRSAYKMLETNDKQFPTFMANKKSLGMLRTIFSAVPNEYKWVLGVNGDFNRGYKEIKSVLDYAEKNPFEFEDEVRIIYSFLLLSVKNDEIRAWRMINHKTIDPKTSLLACYIQTRVAMKIGKNDTAIRLLTNSPQSSDYYSVPQMDYWLGLAKLQKLDKSASKHFKNYINSATSDLFLKSSYLQLAYHAQLFGTEETRKKYLNLCKTKGSTIVYEDKKAMTFVDNKYPKTLLKAQLLINGGYYSQASETLNSISVSIYKYKKSHILYYFLAGRAKHRQKQYSSAIDFYKKTIETGKETKFYYVIQSAIHLGEVYELKKDYTNAKKYYKRCLELKSDQNQSGYHKRAKDALKRLKNK